MMTKKETINTKREQLHQRPVDGDARMQGSQGVKKVCIVGASGKLGRYMVRHALDRGYEVVGVCREESVGKLAEFEGRITVVPGDGQRAGRSSYTTTTRSPTSFTISLRTLWKSATL